VDFSSLPLRTLRIVFSFDLLHKYSRRVELSRIITLMQLAITDSYRAPQTLESLTIDGFTSSRFDSGRGIFITGMVYFSVGLGIESVATIHDMPPRRGASPRWSHVRFNWHAEEGQILSFDHERLRRWESRMLVIY
jgi:hypothetical protein